MLSHLHILLKGLFDQLQSQIGFRTGASSILLGAWPVILHGLMEVHVEQGG
jgi:hypothetical protein